MSILSWIIIGGLAGWLASRLTHNRHMGLLGHVALGVLGAFVGGYLFSFFGQTGFTGFNLYSFFVATIGAAVILTLARILFGR